MSTSETTKKQFRDSLQRQIDAALLAAGINDVNAKVVDRDNTVILEIFASEASLEKSRKVLSAFPVPTLETVIDPKR